MTEEKSTEPLSEVSNNSFVILGPGSFVAMSADDEVEVAENKNLNKMHNITSVSEFCKSGGNNNNWMDTKSPVTETFDMTPQEKLNQLLKENYNLKETLNQNNLAIRTQLSTFFMWQQELLKTHETHKQKFLETKELILKLRAENLELRKELAASSPASLFSFVGKSSRSVDSSEPQQCSECVGKAQECTKIQDLYNKEVEKNESLIIERSELQKIIDNSKKEISILNKSLNDLKGENESLRQKTSEQSRSLGESFSTSLLPNCEARIQISNLFKQLEEERSKVAKLKREADEIKAGNKNQDIKQTPTEELRQCIHELNEMDESFQKQSQRLNGLSSWIYLTEQNFIKSNSLTQGDDGKIISEIASLKSQLSREENNFKQREENLQDMYIQFTKLRNDYKDLQQELNAITMNKSTLEELENKVQTLTSDLANKDEALMAKDKEINTLKEMVKKLNLECEEVSILRIQAEMYRSDFNEERAAREKLVGEKEDMAELVRSLQAVIKDTEKEKKAESSKDSSRESPKEVKSPPPRYVCPKCMFSFSDMRRCQEHIEDCVNIHYYP